MYEFITRIFSRKLSPNKRVLHSNSQFKKPLNLIRSYLFLWDGNNSSALIIFTLTACIIPYISSIIIIRRYESYEPPELWLEQILLSNIASGKKCIYRASQILFIHYLVLWCILDVDCIFKIFTHNMHFRRAWLYWGITSLCKSAPYIRPPTSCHVKNDVFVPVWKWLHYITGI